MEEEILGRFKKFSLSSQEKKGVELRDVDVQLGLEEGKRSLIGKIFGDKRTNFLGVKSAMMKLWQHKGLRKVVALAPNVYQFIFTQVAERELVLTGRPWLFDNYVLVLYPWEEKLCWKDDCFNFSHFWVQVWNVPSYWLSIETGKKIGASLGTVKDVLVRELGGTEERHINIQVELDLTQPLLRGTMLKYKQTEIWVEFKYEHLPIFCYYCGRVGHSEKICLKRQQDIEHNCVVAEQFGGWLRAGNRKIHWEENRGSNVGKGSSGLKSLVIAKHEASRGREEGGCEAGRVMSLGGSGKVQKMGGLELEDQARHGRVYKAREEGWKMDIIENTACEGGN